MQSDVGQSKPSDICRYMQVYAEKCTPVKAVRYLQVYGGICRHMRVRQKPLDIYGPVRLPAG